MYVITKSDLKGVNYMITKANHQLKEINRLYKELNDIYHSISNKLGISDSIFLIFYSIVEMGDGCIQKEISDYYSISRQTINTSVKKLESNGYIFLKKGKGRDMHIFLTEKGEDFIKEKIEPIMVLENSIFDEMSPKESDEFLKLTQKYVNLYRNKVKSIK